MAQFPSPTDASGVWSLKDVRLAVQGSNWPTLVPAPPTITGTSGVAGAAIITFSAGAQGGAPIELFTVTCVETGGTKTGTSSPITFSGLSGGDYTFTITATNSIGTSASSSPSASTTVLNPIFANLLLVAGGGGGGATPSGDGGGRGWRSRRTALLRD